MVYNIIENKYSIDISQLNSGYYFIEVISNNDTNSIKLVKE